MQVMGILNITPDSFSDGGEIQNPNHALQKAKQLVEDGASIVDIGAESTRPEAQKLSHKQEWQRLQPILQVLKNKDLSISVDSYHHQNIEKALPYGIEYINDVNGLTNPRMLEVAANSGLKVIAMHSLTVPANKNITLAPDKNPTDEIITWAEQKLATLIQGGIKKPNIILDIGIGFGKTAKQSWQLIEDAPKISQYFKQLGVKTLYGHSRKSFLNTTAKATILQKDQQTAAITKQLQKANIDIIRVHNAKLNYSALEN